MNEDISQKSNYCFQSVFNRLCEKGLIASLILKDWLKGL